MTGDDFEAEDPAEQQVRWAFGGYERVLKDRGFSEVDVMARMALLSFFEAHARSLGVPSACEQLKRFRRKLRRKGLSKRVLDRCLKATREFCEWQAHSTKPLTEERIRELEQLSQREGAAVPEERLADAVLRAIAQRDPAETVDAVAVYFAGYHGLAARDICGLRVGDVHVKHAAPRARAEPRYVIEADEWLQDALLKVIGDREASEPLLTSERGTPLTPRRLQQRLSRYASELAGDDTRESFTLECLRDHAARWMLENGGTLREIATAFGYPRVASARRRFGSEAWEYLGDRESNWFTLEAAAEAEGLSAEQLRTWVEQDMRHERRGERLYVRKEDVREFGRRPVPSGRPVGRAAEAGPEVADTCDEPVAPAPDARDERFIEALQGVLDFGTPEEWGQAFEDFGKLIQPPESPRPRQLFVELTERTGPILEGLGEARRDMPGPGAAADRLQQVLGRRPEVSEEHSTADCADLLAYFLDVSAIARGLTAGVGTTVDLELGSPVRVGFLRLLDSGHGVRQFESLLRFPREAASFWMLVDRYYDDIKAHLTAAGSYYGILDKNLEAVGPGCLLYAFFLGVLAASAWSPEETPGSIQTPQDLVFECLTYHLFILLNACAVIPLNTRGELLDAPVITHISDDMAFAQAFCSRWERLRPFRRGPWSFHVVPAVSVFDIVRYRDLAARGRGAPLDKTAQAAANYLLYLSKVPVPPEKARYAPASALSECRKPESGARMAGLCPPARIATDVIHRREEAHSLSSLPYAAPPSHTHFDAA